MIRLEGVTKQYGKFTAVHPLDLHVRRGELFGFLGPNGAGKTTTMRMIAQILRPTSGDILIGGVPTWEKPQVIKQMIGYIPDRPYVYDKLTGAEFVRFVAALYGQEGSSVERRMNELLEVFELVRDLIFVLVAPFVGEYLGPAAELDGLAIHDQHGALRSASPTPTPHDLDPSRFGEGRLRVVGLKILAGRTFFFLHVPPR